MTDAYIDWRALAMSRELSATFELKGWDESPIEGDAESAKVTRATVSRTVTGGLAGSSVIEYLMAYGADGTAAFVGMERFAGSVDGRNGTVVLQHVGRFEGGEARGTLEIVRGSGTADLAGVAGTGDYAAPVGPRGTIRLDVE
jgi:hypothetical protein